MKSISFIVPTKIYPVKVGYIIYKEPDPEAEEQMAKRLKLKPGLIKPMHKSYLGLCMQFDTGQVLVRLNYDPKDPAKFLSVLAHEHHHAIFYILRWIGVEHSEASEEAFAYLNGYLTAQVLKQLNISIKNPFV